MRNPVFLSVFFQVSYAFSYVRVHNFEINYLITSEGSCNSVKSRFLLFESSIENCVKECGSRPHCQALNFRRGICELFSSSEKGQSSNVDCILVEKQDINVIQSPCKNHCNYGEVCETTDSGIGRCVIKECVNVTVPVHGEILGNQRKIGNKIRYRCHKGYKEKNDTYATVAECLNTGTWSAHANCRKINYTWTMWTDWSHCSLSCGIGTRTRSRICSIASEDLFEEPCNEDDISDEGESCNEQSCPSISRNCSDDTDCIETKGTCIEGICFCNRLYRYNTNINNCTKVCQSMTNGFKKISNIYIRGFNSNASDMTKNTTEDCEIACRDKSECLSFEVWPNNDGPGVKCTTGSVTYEMIKDAHHWELSNSSKYDLYTRGCN